MPKLTEFQIEKIRNFNRFYTKLIGLLNEGLLKSEFSLIEARIIYELGQDESKVATSLRHELGLDAGYLSRIVNRLVKQALIFKTPDAKDGRQSLLSLTDAGKKIQQELRARSQNQIAQLFESINIVHATQIVSSMGKIQSLLDEETGQQQAYILREPEVGDLSYISHRQAVLYNLEYGFDNRFEAIVSKVVGEYVDNYNAKLDKCWIAEHNDKIVGSIFCVNGGDGVAKLRLLYVEPEARGLGIGKKLVEQVEKFARLKQYQKIEFWTVDCLPAALNLYKKLGFKMIKETELDDFGVKLMRQDWEKIL